MLRNEATAALQAILSCQEQQAVCRRHGSEASMHDCAQGHEVPLRNLVIFAWSPNLQLYAIPIVVPTLKSTQTVIYKADSMWLHCYVFQRFVLVAVCSEWNASLGQVEFQGARWVQNDRGTAFDGLALV
jgi:hypothetical protein